MNVGFRRHSGLVLPIPVGIYAEGGFMGSGVSMAHLILGLEHDNGQ